MTEVQIPAALEPYVKMTDDFMLDYKKFTFYEQFEKIEEKTGYPKAFFFVATTIVLGAIIVAIGGAEFVVDMLGFAYPTYMSLYTMDADPEGSAQWLTYWVAFSGFSIFENMASFILELIPFYFWIKCAFILWMWHPSTRGSTVIFDLALRPALEEPPKDPVEKKDD